VERTFGLSLSSPTEQGPLVVDGYEEYRDRDVEEEQKIYTLLDLYRPELVREFNGFDTYKAERRSHRPSKIRTEWGPGGYVPDKLEWIEGTTIPKATTLEEISGMPLGEQLRAFLHRESLRDYSARRVYIAGNKGDPDSLYMVVPKRTGRFVRTPWGRFRPNELLVAYVTGQAYRWNSDTRGKELGVGEGAGLTFGQLKNYHIGGWPLIGEENKYPRESNHLTQQEQQ
jgi:hypothetical protein